MAPMRGAATAGERSESPPGSPWCFVRALLGGGQPPSPGPSPESAKGWTWTTPGVPRTDRAATGAGPGARARLAGRTAAERGRVRACTSSPSPSEPLSPPRDHRPLRRARAGSETASASPPNPTRARRRAPGGGGARGSGGARARGGGAGPRAAGSGGHRVPTSDCACAGAGPRAAAAPAPAAATFPRCARIRIAAMVLGKSPARPPLPFSSLAPPHLDFSGLGGPPAPGGSGITLGGPPAPGGPGRSPARRGSANQRPPRPPPPPPRRSGYRPSWEPPGAPGGPVDPVTARAGTPPPPPPLPIGRPVPASH